MPTSDPIQILLLQNHWAMSQMLNTCATLSAEQFHHKFEMGFGSIHDNVTHMLAALQVWGDVLAGREQRPRLEGTNRSVEELKSLLEEIVADLDQSAKKFPHDGLVTRERGGKSYTFPRSVVITQVTTHGFHHRAQCLNMLRQLGISPLPMSSVVEWAVATDSAK